jgi:FtsZ-interacting cell division protein ZipA
MTTTTTVIVIAIVVVLLLVVIGAVLASRRTKEHRRQQAEQVRAEAAAHTGEVRSSHEDLAVAQSRADIARVEAERAEAEAAEARRVLDMDRARHEDRLREADAIDPDVDHRADDYEPGTGQHRAT